MGRPLTKMTLSKLRFLLENSGKLSTVKIGKKLGIDHSTVIHYQKKLKKAGYKITKFDPGEANRLISRI